MPSIRPNPPAAPGAAGRAGGAVTVTPSDIMSAAVRQPAGISFTPPPAAIWCRKQPPRRAGLGGGCCCCCRWWWWCSPAPPPPRSGFSPRCTGRGSLPAAPAGAPERPAPGAPLAGDGVGAGAERRRLRRGHLPPPGVRGRPAGGSPGRDASWVRGAPSGARRGPGRGPPRRRLPTPARTPARCRLRRRCGSIN